MTGEAQRAELHKTIWRIANDLRGSVDGWDFKTYVLGMLFYRFISENLTAYLNEHEREAGDADFDYADASRRGRGVRPRRRRSPRRASTSSRASCSPTCASGPRTTRTSTRRWSGSSQNIEGSAVGADSEDDLKGLFDDLDVNSAKLGPTVAKRNEKLVKLLDAIGDLQPRQTFTDNTIDAFGDAYEYLMHDVRLERRQVRRRVLHAAGGLRAARPDHRRRQDRGQQGLRPRLRLGLAAAEVRQGARHGQRPPGLLRSGDQPDHLQPRAGSTCSCTTSTTRSSTSRTATR